MAKTKVVAKKQQTSLQKNLPVILALVCVLLLGLDGPIVLWGWTFLTLLAGLVLFLVRSEIKQRAGLFTTALVWAAVVPAAASLAIDTGKLMHYGLSFIALAVAVHFFREGIVFGRHSKR